MSKAGYARINNHTIINLNEIENKQPKSENFENENISTFQDKKSTIFTISTFILLVLFSYYLFFESNGIPPLSNEDSPVVTIPFVSVILTADDGSMVGISEGMEIKELLTESHYVVFDQETLFCEDVTHGTLFGSSIILATTGIGHDRAALCLRGLLSAYHEIIKEIMFLGTGGFSPALGGVLNSEDCDSPVVPTKDTIVPIGSVCVSPITTNWDCHKCVWPAKVESACQEAPCTMHDRSDIFGDYGCSYYTTPTLADELLDASKFLDPALPNPELQSLSRRYWDAMSNGTGQPYSDFLGDMKPKVFDYTQCAEATSNTFWVGTPYDELARKYVASVINDAFSSELFHQTKPRRNLLEPATKYSTVTVSAMEGVGWMEVLALEEVLLKYNRIPAVNIRGAADYTTPPLSKEYQVVKDANADANQEDSGEWNGNWNELAQFSEDLQGDSFTTQGYLFAMHTTSEIVLNLFKTRQNALASS